ncbi:MAG TPA: phosphatase PAP2 family protein, partial [Acidimicrobiales bacterium]|nr:phosphatase PAP2 family protein [Acidimicrobiales bacterium]
MRQLDSSRTASVDWSRTVTRPMWWRELLLILVGYGLYHEVQIHSPSTEALRHGLDILRVEQWAHLDVDRWVNSAFASSSWLAVPAGYYYALLHFAVTVGVLVWLWIRHPDSYRTARRVIVTGTLTALTIFWTFPAAPPRLLPHAGFIDTAVRYRIPLDLEAGKASKAADLFATMPSLHFAWALWCAWAVWRVARTSTARRLVWVYPALTALVVLGTANHFVLDLAGGAIVMAAGAGIALLIPSLVRQALAPSLRPRKSGRWALGLAALAGPVALAVAVAAQHRFVAKSFHAIGHAKPLWVLGAVVAELGSMSAFSRLHRRALRITGVVVRQRTAQAINYASNAISATVPLVGSAAGAANTWRQYQRRGVSPPAIAWALGAAGVASAVAFTLLMGAGAATTGNTATIGAGAGATSLAIGMMIVLFAGIRLQGLRTRIERLAAAAIALTLQKTHRSGADSATMVVRRFIETIGSYRPRLRDVTVAMTAAMVNWALDVACLAASIRAVGGHIPAADLIVIWA